MSEDRSNKKILLALVVVLLAVGGAGFFFVYKAGLKREGIFEQAERAMKEKRFDDVIKFAKETLVSNPEHPNARVLLLHALVETKQLDEARDKAEEYWANGAGDVFAGRHLCQVAMNDRRYRAAERIALILTDKEPAIAYQLLAFIPDMRGLEMDDVRSRLSAAETMRDSASIVDDHTHRAVALLFSASVLMEIAPYVPARDAVVARARETLREAVTAANQARTHDNSFNYDVVMGSIHVLSGDLNDAELGAKMLSAYTDGVLRDESAIAMLAKYAMDRQDWDEAVRLAGSLQKSYWWLRTYWHARAGGNLDATMRMIDTAPILSDLDRDVLRADALLRGGKKDEAKTRLEEIITNTEATPSQIIRALVRLQQGFGVKAAVAAADSAKLADRDDTNLKALLASLMLSGEGSDERGLEFVRQLVAGGNIGGMPLSGAARASFLARRLESASDNTAELHLERAMVQLGRAQANGDPTDEKTKKLLADVREDLGALVEDKQSSKPVLCQAFLIATAVRDTALAGRLIGRAIAMEGEPAAIDVDVLRNARRLPDGRVPTTFVEGIRSVAKTSPADRFVNVFADAVENRVQDPAELLSALEAAAADEGSAPFALRLAGRVAISLQELAKAEEFGRRLLSIRPGNMHALQIIGTVLTLRNEYAEVLELYKGAPETITGAGQQVMALLRLDRKEEALALARTTRNSEPHSPIAAQILAQTYAEMGGDSNLRKALAVLSRVGSRPDVKHVRAEILLRLDEKSRASHIYEAILNTSRFADFRAWNGLMISKMPNRLQEFADFSGHVLADQRLHLTPNVRAHVHMARGTALETLGEMKDALSEYEAAAKEDPAQWQARNNAAWHIATIPVRGRLPEARAHIEAALEIARKKPDLVAADTASLHDTAAEVYAVLGKKEEALRHINDALGEVSKEKYVRYATHKAKIFLRFKEKDNAKRLLETLVKEFSTDAHIAQARDMLSEIHVSEQVITEDGGEILPDLPDDEDPEDKDDNEKEGKEE